MFVYDSGDNISDMAVISNIWYFLIQNIFVQRPALPVAGGAERPRNRARTSWREASAQLRGKQLSSCCQNNMVGSKMCHKMSLKSWTKNVKKQLTPIQRLPGVLENTQTNHNHKEIQKQPEKLNLSPNVQVQEWGWSSCWRSDLQFGGELWWGEGYTGEQFWDFRINIETMIDFVETGAILRLPTIQCLGFSWLVSFKGWQHASKSKYKTFG